MTLNINYRELQSSITTRKGILWCTVLISLLFLVNVATYHAAEPYNSDEVAQQTIASMAGKYGPMHAWSGPENYALKYPLYVVIDHILGENRLALVVVSLLFCMVLLGCLIATYFILYRSNSSQNVFFTLLVGWWLASVGDPTATFANPNGRNAELGIVILLSSILFKFSSSRLTKHRADTALIIMSSVALGALMASDPYFLFIFLPVLCLLPFVLKAYKNQVQIWSKPHYLSLLGIFCGYMLFHVFYRHLGLLTQSTSAVAVFTPLPGLGNNLVHAFDGLLTNFNGNFFGKSVLDINTGLMFLNGCLVIGIVYYFCKQFRTQLHDRTRMGGATVLFMLIAVVTLLSFVLSASSGQQETARYLILLPVVCFYVLPQLLKQNVLLVPILSVLGLCAFLNTSYDVAKVVQASTAPDSNRVNNELISTIEKYRLGKGYSQYWDANINTYLSDDKLVVIPLSCTKGSLAVYHILMDDSWENIPASRTYYILDNSATTFEQCDAKALAKAFGMPEKVIPVEDKEILIYNYDLLKRLGS